MIAQDVLPLHDDETIRSRFLFEGRDIRDSVVTDCTNLKTQMPAGKLTIRQFTRLGDFAAE